MMVMRNRLKKEKETGNLISRSKGGKTMRVCILPTDEKEPSHLLLLVPSIPTSVLPI
jgi:hypothetical protein